MPYRERQTEKWIGEFQIGTKPDHRRYRKKGFESEEDALEWEVSEKDLILNPPDPTISVSLNPCLIKYLRFCEKRWKLNTYRNKASIFIQMFEFWEEDPLLEDLKPLLFTDYLDHIFETKGGTTANRYLREINTGMNWCIENELLGNNPAGSIKNYAAEPFKKYVPPAKDFDLVEAAANPMEKDIINTVYYTLARSGEIRYMQWSDVDFENNILTLWTQKREGGRLESDDLEISPDMREILYRRYVTRDEEELYIFPGPKGGQLSKNTMDKIMPRLMKRLNKDKPKDLQIKPFGLHSIRHHSAALLATQLDLLTIQKILRHKRASTTDAYLRSIVKISTKGISVLDKIRKERKTKKEVNIVSFERAANEK